MVDATRLRLTYRAELWRAVTAGILETAATTFLLLIAVRWFAAGPVAKALVAAAGSIGLLVSPAVVSAVSTAHIPASRASAFLMAFGALAFAVAAALHDSEP